MFYPQLFRSGKIGTMEVKNRIVMPAMEVLAAGFSDAIFAGKVEEIYEYEREQKHWKAG
nr:hypothetical protein [uncultured Anaerostipes sp.]